MDSTIQNSVPHPVVRNEVRRILTQSTAYRNLPEDVRRELAHDMAKVANYITLGESGDNVPAAVVLADDATTGANPPSGTPQRPQDVAGDRLSKSGAVAAKQGSKAFTETINEVNFPKFVGGLIQ